MSANKKRLQILNLQPSHFQVARARLELATS